MEQRYPLGSPCWVELSAEDIDEAARFYRGLFGWEVSRLESGYPVFTLEGEAVAGIWPEPVSGGSASWTVYFAVEDIRSLNSLVEDAGGKVVLEPVPLEDHGVLGGYIDRERVHFMGWEPHGRYGAEVSGRDCTWGWTELVTRDVEGAKDFYPRVFGWGRVGEGDQTLWTVEGRPVASMAPIPPDVPGEGLSAWIVQFAVPDLMEWARRAEDLGAHRIVEFDDPVHGPAVALTGTQNAIFVLIPTSSLETRRRTPSPGAPKVLSRSGRIIRPPA
ncbi:VOC family protein [Actinocorallia herbida]|nr:VOC family protein [Actinocorallia herbida]